MRHCGGAVRRWCCRCGLCWPTRSSHRGLRDADLNDLVEPWTGDEGQPAFYRQIAQYDERFLRENEERLDRISTPVRILWGTEDAWIPTDLAHKLADLIPNASLQLIEGAGHLIQYDAPIALADQLRAWLTKTATRPDKKQPDDSRSF